MQQHFGVPDSVDPVDTYLILWKRGAAGLPGLNQDPLLSILGVHNDTDLTNCGFSFFLSFFLFVRDVVCVYSGLVKNTKPLWPLIEIKDDS